LSAAQPTVAPAEAALATVARLLAARGRDAVPDALVVALAAVGCTELVLRSSHAGEVLGRAARLGVPLSSVPVQSRGVPWALDVPLRSCGALQGVLTASSDEPFTADQAGVLTGMGDLLALGLSAAGPGDDVADAGRAVLDAEADRAQVATAMHETVGEALVTIRYTADLIASGRCGPGELDEPVRAALAALRVAHRDMRAYALEAGLLSALRELPTRGGGDRPADDRPALQVAVTAEDPRLDALPPPVAVTVQRVAEAALRDAGGRVEVVATYDGQRVKLCVESAEIAYDASELDRWARRASALGGDLRVRPDGVELNLPAQLPAREGHHDNGPDL
jgi:hypothetical protein